MTISALFCCSSEAFIGVCAIYRANSIYGKFVKTFAGILTLRTAPETLSKLRARVERKLRKRLRQVCRSEAGRATAREIQRREAAGVSLETALRDLLLDGEAGWMVRGEAGRILAIASQCSVVDELLTQFFSQTEKSELWETALTLEQFEDEHAIRPLISALSDHDVDRRRAAARALGWMPRTRTCAARALSEALTDVSQPVSVREEAAESLAYLSSRSSIPPLISVLDDPSVQVRFWSVFALGSIRNRRSGHSYPEVIAPLEAMLSDHHSLNETWWTVAREALAMLGQLVPPVPKWNDRFRQELTQATEAVDATAEDRRWAQFYSHCI